jgi:hypothetical protein
MDWHCDKETICVSLTLGHTKTAKTNKQQAHRHASVHKVVKADWALGRELVKTALNSFQDGREKGFERVVEGLCE